MIIRLIYDHTDDFDRDSVIIRCIEIDCVDEYI